MLWLLNVLAYLVNAVVVGSSQLGWLGSSNDEVSSENPTMVTPDGWAFSIWGLIFFSEAVFVVWGAFPSNRDRRVVTEGVGLWFSIACLLQVAWSIVFAQELLIISAILLCGIALSLLMAVVCLAPFKVQDDTLLFFSIPFWVVQFPIGLHGGWTCAAALVNINVALELTGVSSEITALILTIVGAVFGAVVASLIFYDPIYLISIVWAIAGIASKQDYREERVGGPVADGINDALQGLWIALLCVGFFGFLAAMRERNRRTGEKDGYTPGPNSGRTLTTAIFSS